MTLCHKDPERVEAVFRGPLHAGTLDLHHHIEHYTALGSVIGAGQSSLEQYARWLSMKARFFDAIEHAIPPACRRADLCRSDLEAMGLDIPLHTAAESHVRWVGDTDAPASERERRVTGTAYVCVGTVFGSAVIRKALEKRGVDWPMTALKFVDRETEIAFMAQLRQRGDCIMQARRTFAAMSQVCDE